MRYLVTGGAGFIGSNFIRFLFNKYGDDTRVVNLDKLTYAGIRENLGEYEGKKNYRFVHGDIARPADVGRGVQGCRRKRRRRRRELRGGIARRPLHR
jgi:dTDP-D-glucose 4,6-dehydratase